MVEMDCLPDHIILHILKYLDYKSLCRTASLQSRYAELSQHDELWKDLCHRIWLLETYMEGCNSWFTSFRGMYEQFGFCVDQYASVRRAWDRILAILDQRAPAIRHSLLAGLTEDQLLVIESQLGCPLPPDLRCSYKIFRGQRSCGGAQGLFGNYDLNSPGDYLLPLLTTHHQYSVVRKTEFNSVPIVGCGGGSRTDIHICVSDSGEQFLRTGTVFAVAGVNGTGRHDVKFQMFRYEFLEDWADKLAVYPIINETVLKYEDNSFERTGPISVKVTTAFWREESFCHFDALADRQPRKARFAYHYRITLKMESGISQSNSCQLETRHWEITDEDGHVETVNGPGVVGTFPTLTPGSEYTYISGTSYKTTYGSMKGYYTMRNLESGEQFNINIGTFHMRPPPVLTYSQRQLDWPRQQ